MTGFNRLMTRQNGLLITLIVLTLVTGCSNNLLRSGKATSTDTAREVVDTLAVDDQSGESGNADAGQPAPRDMTAALLPDIQAQAPEDERFDVNAQGLAARGFFEALVEGTRYNVVVEPSVTARIDLRLNDVSVPEVMDIAADVYDLDIRRQGRLFRVGENRVQTRIFPIDYLHFKRSGGSETRVSSGQVTNARTGNAGSDNGGNQDSGASNLVGTRISTDTESDFWADIDRALSMIVGTADGQQVIINPGAGLVMVRGLPEVLRQVEDYLTRTQLILQRQVILEAKILEVALNEAYQQGINWSDIQSASSVTASDGLPAEFTAQSLTAQSLATNGIGGVFSATIREGTFTGLIELLGQQGNVQILSSPRISTMNNQKAVIKVGTDEFFVTDIDFDDNNSAVAATNNTSTSVELTPFFSGISLDVTPQISEQGEIILHVHPSVSEVADQEKVITVGERDVTLPLARSTVRETDSVIRAESGQIVVIGGLIQSSSEDNNSAVPFLSDIPLLGEFFKQRRFESKKSELVILLRPVVVGSGEMRADIAATRERMQVLKELLESAESVTPQGEQADR
jgi:MSHA biogenesis protein MshL